MMNGMMKFQKTPKLSHWGGCCKDRMTKDNQK